MTEITLKEWVGREATKSGVSLRAIYNRFYRGKYPNLKLRQANKRVVFVEVEEQMNIYRETMCRYTLEPYTIRVWREINPSRLAKPGPDMDVKALLRGQCYDVTVLLATILSLPGVNAVEILDEHGNGEVNYRSEEIEVNGRKFQVI